MKPPQPLMNWALWILTFPLEPSPWWTRAPVPLLLLLHPASVEVVPTPNREGTRDRFKHLFSAGNPSKRVWNGTSGCAHEYLHLGGRDSANCSDSVVHTLEKKKNPGPSFRYLGACCSAPTPVHHTPRSRLLFFHFSYSIYH